MQVKRAFVLHFVQIIQVLGGEDRPKRDPPSPHLATPVRCPGSDLLGHLLRHIFVTLVDQGRLRLRSNRPRQTRRRILVPKLPLAPAVDYDPLVEIQQLLLQHLLKRFLGLGCQRVDHADVRGCGDALQHRAQRAKLLLWNDCGGVQQLEDRRGDGILLRDVHVQDQSNVFRLEVRNHCHQGHRKHPAATAEGLHLRRPEEQHILKLAGLRKVVLVDSAERLHLL
eukprot:scaffold2249_cov272-Pinguiococcus_pyrenoidosus.AAC.9